VESQETADQTDPPDLTELQEHPETTDQLDDQDDPVVLDFPESVDPWDPVVTTELTERWEQMEPPEFKVQPEQPEAKV